MEKNLDFKKLGIITLSATILTGGILPVIGHAESNQKKTSIIQQENSTIEITPSPEAISFINTMTSKGLFNEFTHDLNGKLSLKHSLNEVKTMYNLTQNEINNLQLIINIGQGQNNQLINPTMGFSHGTSWVKIKLSKSEVAASLFAAGSVSAEAVEATIIAWGTITGGPVGTIIASVIGYFGTSSFLSVANTGIKAFEKKKGMYIKLGIDGFLPYLKSGLA